MSRFSHNLTDAVVSINTEIDATLHRHPLDHRYMKMLIHASDVISKVLQYNAISYPKVDSHKITYQLKDDT